VASRRGYDGLLLVSKRPSVTRPFALLAGSLTAVVVLLAGAAARSATPLAQVGTPRVTGVGDLAQRGTIQTIVIDPGHGGDDVGVEGSNGAKEKDVVFQIAQQLKSAIETKLSIKVLLTRDTDEAVPVDQRAVFANQQKADLFLSLHANASVRPELRGTEVVTLNPADYLPRPPPAPPAGRGKPPTPPPPPPQIPVAGGGFRVLEPVLWELAQLPFVEKSAMFSATLVKRLTERAIPSNTPPLATTAPVRVLVGANMPAVLIELGFLTNAEDEAALTSPTVPNEIIEAILAAIGDVRFGFPAPAATPRITK